MINTYLAWFNAGCAFVLVALLLDLYMNDPTDLPQTFEEFKL